MTTEHKATSGTVEPASLPPSLQARPKTDPRLWLAFGTGAAIEIRENDLYVCIARVRPSRTDLIGAMKVTDFVHQPAAQWGREISEFLRRNGAGYIALTVLLPRRDVIVRQLQLPGVANRDLAAAVSLQLESLHPFAEDEVSFSWSRLGKTPNVLVGICRREVMDSFWTLFNEAGLKVGAFTFSAAVLYSAMRLNTTPPEPLMVWHDTGDGIEVYGESDARPIFTATLPVSQERAVSLARGELRVDPDTPATRLTAMLPAPASAPEQLDSASPAFQPFVLPWAAALAGACPWLGVDGNLLPPDRRRSSSRVRLIPTIVLSITLGVLVILVGLHSQWADSRYLTVLQMEVGKFEPRARRVDQLDKGITEARGRSQRLDEFRRRARLDMDTLAEVTKLIPPPGWVTNLDLDRQTIQIAGEAEQAAPLIEKFDASSLFDKSQFMMPISRTPSGEIFRIRAERQVPPLGVRPPAPVPAQAPAQQAPAAQQPAPAKPQSPTPAAAGGQK
jgi:Tfp pilus assembly protein PilN